ncbi:glycosyltransferase family 4 protein [Flavitalea flava]
MVPIEIPIKRYYISSMDGMSGICKYSRDFYRLVLRDRGYIFMDSARSLTSIFTAISSRDHIHIEIGIFQKKEIEILFAMLRANYKNISVTLHDAPLIRYPFHEFRTPFLNKISKFFDRFINNHGMVEQYIKKIKSIYVLSKKGVLSVKKRYGIENVQYLPHIVDTAEIIKSDTDNDNFIYFGFIGRNKGLEYALQLHRQLLASQPGINFYVVGRPLGKEKKFYDQLKEKYKKNVHYLGYIPEEQLHAIFEKALFAVLLFKDYRFFWPLNGSILYSLKKGKIVLTNKVNTIPEIIGDGENGFYLSGNLKEDSNKIIKILGDKPALNNMKEVSYRYLLQNHSGKIVNEQFND